MDAITYTPGFSIHPNGNGFAVYYGNEDGAMDIIANADTREEAEAAQAELAAEMGEEDEAEATTTDLSTIQPGTTFTHYGHAMRYTRTETGVMVAPADQPELGHEFPDFEATSGNDLAMGLHELADMVAWELDHA